MPRTSREQLDGFGGESACITLDPDARQFPDSAERRKGEQREARPVCIGPLAYRDLNAVRGDIANLKGTLAGVDFVNASMTAASPGVIAQNLESQHHPSDDE